MAISPADAADSSTASRCSVASGTARRAACSVTAAEPLASAEAMNKPPSNSLFAHNGMLVAARSRPPSPRARSRSALPRSTLDGARRDSRSSRDSLATPEDERADQGESEADGRAPAVALPHRLARQPWDLGQVVRLWLVQQKKERVQRTDLGCLFAFGHAVQLRFRLPPRFQLRQAAPPTLVPVLAL